MGYTWKLTWNGSVYRGRWIPGRFRDIWWVPFLLIAGPLTPAWVAAGIYWLLHWL